MEAEQVNQLSHQQEKQGYPVVHEWFSRRAIQKPRPRPLGRASGMAALALGLILSASSARAQGHVEGQGFWFTLGGGPGSNRIDCDQCETIDRFWGGQGYLQAGGTLSDNFQVGGEIAFWHRSGEENDATIIGVHSIAHWFPFHAGFFVKGGLGVTHVKSEFDVASERENGGATGLGVELGLGWDLPIGDSFSLVPTAGSMVAAVGGVDLSVGPINNVVSTTWSLGLGFSYRPKR